jgi:hypothetical protein
MFSDITNERIYAASDPDLDILFHRYYGNGSTAVLPYSADWNTTQRLALDYNFEPSGWAVGGHVVMDLYHNNQYLKIGDSTKIERVPGNEVPTEVLAKLAVRSLLKLAFYRSDLYTEAVSSKQTQS